MATYPGAHRALSDLPCFDGFPYLVTRVVPGLNHIILLPAGQSEEWYHDLLRDQVEANRLDSCLVLNALTAWYWNLDGGLSEARPAPRGGAIW